MEFSICQFYLRPTAGWCQYKKQKQKQTKKQADIYKIKEPILCAESIHVISFLWRTFMQTRTPSPTLDTGSILFDNNQELVGTQVHYVLNLFEEI